MDVDPFVGRSVCPSVCLSVCPPFACIQEESSSQFLLGVVVYFKRFSPDLNYISDRRSTGTERSQGFRVQGLRFQTLSSGL